MRTVSHRLSTLIVAAGGLIAAAATATARADMPKMIDEAAGLYVGAGVGRSDYVDGCSSAGSVVTSCDTSDTAWKAYGGYQLNKWLSGEVAYVDFGNANFGGTRGGASFGAKTETWGITAQAVAQVPIPLDVAVINKISVLGKLGAIYWDQKLSSNLPAISGSDTGWDLAWGFGLQYTFNEHLGIRAEWEQFNNVGTGSTGGESDIRVWTVGVNYKF